MEVFLEQDMIEYRKFWGFHDKLEREQELNDKEQTHIIRRDFMFDVSFRNLRELLENNSNFKNVYEASFGAIYFRYKDKFTCMIKRVERDFYVFSIKETLNIYMLKDLDYKLIYMQIKEKLEPSLTFSKKYVRM